MARRFSALVALVSGAALLAGCDTLPKPQGDFADTTAIGSHGATAQTAYAPDTGGRVIPNQTPFHHFTGGRDLEQAKAHFRAANFGLAERHYRKAVEKNPDDAEAWLGLAASYDQLGRFDHADRAYKRLAALTGQTATLLNNLGYSYLLRGDVAGARQKLAAAKKLSPANATIDGNLALLAQNTRVASAAR